MKFIFNHRWLRPGQNLSTLTKHKICKLNGRVRIEGAEVTLEKISASSPPFLARVHLMVPGPDLYAEERDHTPEAAIHKVLAKLSRQIRQRKEKRLSKRRDGAEESRPWNRPGQPLSVQPA